MQRRDFIKTMTAGTGALALSLAYNLTEAQDVATRLYFTPDISALQSKYNPGGIPTYEFRWMGVLHQVWLVAVDEVHHADMLTIHPDVLAVPLNLDNAIPNNGARNTVRDGLEQLDIPATNWVQTGMTYRYIVRVVIHFMSYSMRYHNMANDVGAQSFPQIGYDTLISAIPLEPERNLLMTAANQLGYNYQGVAGSDTLRQALKTIVQNQESVQIEFGGLLI